MVKTKELIICIISIIALVLAITTNAFAVNDTQDINALLGNATTDMNNQKIQIFNANFTAYEGTKKGSEIKNIYNVVKASNEADSEHQISLSGVSEEEIGMTKEYTVSLQKDAEGYVNQITIKENTEFQVIGGTTNTTNTTNSTNTNSANNTTNTMPDTGVSYSSLVVIAIAAVSAVYAYKKIKEYNV